MDGILIVDKPVGMTSHDVVDRVRRITGVKKVGHGGTLDPLASGVLPILIGKATKMSDKVIGSEKEYLATIKFGENTDTDDAEGEVISKRDVPEKNNIEIEDILKKFQGTIEQVPPKYSAIKYKGRPLYKLARKGIEVEMPPRQVQISNISIISWSCPLLTLKINCSKGTYIRALARDIGEVIGCGGHVTELRRMACGDFKIEDAKKLNEISNEISTLQTLIPMIVTHSDL